MCRTLLIVSIGLLNFPLSMVALEPGQGLKVTPLLQTTQTWDGKPLVYPKGEAEITAMIIEIAPRSQTGWHLHPVPSVAWVMEGELQVRLKDGQLRVLHPGDCFAEVVNTLHNGRNNGPATVKLFVLYTGIKDKPLTIRDKGFGQSIPSDTTQ